MEETEKLKLSKAQELLLMRLIDFGSIWNFDSELLKNKTYKLLFDWKDIEHLKTGARHKGVGKDETGSNDGDKDKDDGSQIAIDTDAK